METHQSDTQLEQTAPPSPDPTGPVPGDSDNPGQTPDEVRPDQGGDTDNPDFGGSEVQPGEGDVDSPGGTPSEAPSIDPNPATMLPPD